jgi:hypothetical protein
LCPEGEAALVHRGGESSGLSSGSGWGSSYYVAAVAVEVVSRVRVGGGACVDRLVCHPVLPLVAGEESPGTSSSFRPVVHVWDCGGGELRDDRDHYAHLVVKDGLRSWEPGIR